MVLAFAFLAVGFVLLAFVERHRFASFRAHMERELQAREEAGRRRRSDAATLQVAVSTQESVVSDLVSLFELVREFNECMDFYEMADVMTNQVFERVPFRQSKLIFVEEEPQRMPLVFQPQGAGEDAGAADLLASDRRLVSYLARSKKDLWISGAASDHPVDLKDAVHEYPFWAFPLLSGSEMIAVLVVEGGREEDFEKFQILAAQLALHVKRIRLYTVVKELSIVDDLTQMFVRRHFLERFDEELRRSLARKFPVAVLMLDIDHFKHYNDSHGHLAGDHALRETARTVRESIRPVDIAARYGGEEFVMVLPETDKATGAEVGERIRAAIEKQVLVAFGEKTSVTVSIGVAGFPEDISGARDARFHPYLALDLLKVSDRALYQAKARGRNCVVAFESGKEDSL